MAEARETSTVSQFAKSKEYEDFFRMIRKGDIASMEAHVKQFPHIDLVNTPADEHNDTAMHEACLYNKIEVVRWLLERGASFDVKNNDDETPLQLSLNDENPEFTRQIVALGAK